MTKKLNIDAIQSELRGGSAFFPGYKGDDSPTPPTESNIQSDSPQRLSADKPVPPVRVVRGVRPVLPPVKRVMKSRHPFDIYQDQYETLLDLALEDRKRGGIGSMSAMVREAIDNYVAEKRKEK